MIAVTTDRLADRRALLESQVDANGSEVKVEMSRRHRQALAE